MAFQRNYEPIDKPHRVVDKGLMAGPRSPICEYCRNPASCHRHHIKTRGSGGGDVGTNLIDLCPSCHDKAHKALIGKRELLAIAGERETTKPMARAA